MATIEQITAELQSHAADDQLLALRLADVQASLADFQAKDLAEDASYEKQIADLKALVAKLQPPPVLPQSGTKELMGTSKRAGESVAQMSARLPSGWGLREFYGSLSSTVTMPAGCAWQHGSFKPANVAAITDAAVKAAVAKLRFASAWHEIDVKARAYDAAVAAGKTPTTPSKATMIAMSNAMADSIARQKLPVEYVLVVSYWSIAKGNTSKVHRLDSFNGVKGQILGLDVDGADAVPGERDWLSACLATGELVKFLKANPSFVAVSFPEWGDPRHPNDPEGARRSLVFKRSMAALPAFEKTLSEQVGRPIEVRSVNLYEYNRGDAMRYYAFDSPAETKALADVISGRP